MAGNKLSRKVRFLPYFPFGYCSKLATTIEGKANPYATRFLLGDDLDTVIAQSDKHRKNTLDRARYLCDKGYAKDTLRACGTPPIQRSFRHLTKLGLTVFIEAPDEAAAESKDDTDETSAQLAVNNGKIKDDHLALFILLISG